MVCERLCSGNLRDLRWCFPEQPHGSSNFLQLLHPSAAAPQSHQPTLRHSGDVPGTAPCHSPRDGEKAHVVMLKDGSTDRKGTERHRRRSPHFGGQQSARAGGKTLGTALPSAHLHTGAEHQRTEERQQCFSESPPELANHSQRTIYSSHSHLISVHKQIIASMKFLLARNYAANISADVSPANCLLPALLPLHSRKSELLC